MTQRPQGTIIIEDGKDVETLTPSLHQSHKDGIATEALRDLAAYGQHITRDGVRIDPNDFYLSPDAAQHATDHSGLAQTVELRCSSYRSHSVSMVPAIFNPETGAPTSHHRTSDGLIGERVKYHEAECLIVTQTDVIDIRGEGKLA